MMGDDPQNRRECDPQTPAISVRELSVDVERFSDSVDANAAPASIETWQFSLLAGARQRGWMHDLLDDYEQQRAARFLFDKHRHRFVVAHAMLRTIIASQVGLSARDLEWDYANLGKPSLNRSQNAGGLHFNLSHSGDLGFLAVSRSGPVGADIEGVKQMRDALALAKVHYSKTEFERLERSPNDELFFRYWTRKEALLKATGKGLSGGLKNFCTAGNPSESCGTVVSCNPSTPLTESWQYFDCPVPDNYYAAIVSNFRPARIVCNRLGGGHDQDA